MKYILTIITLIIIALSGIYFYFSQSLAPRDIPAMVLAAENAITPVGTVAIASIDMEYVKRIDNIVNDGNLSETWFTPEGDDNLASNLQKQGVNLITQTDYALMSLIVSEKGATYTNVLLGNYSIDKIKQEVRKNYIIKEYQDDIWTIKPNLALIKNNDPCFIPSKIKQKAPKLKAIHWKKDRIIITAPEFMQILLKRFRSNEPANVDLAKWQRFRNDKVVAGAIISPKIAKKGATDMTSAIILGGASKQPLDDIYIGAAVNLLPPQGLKLVFDAYSSDAKWVSETKSKYDNWANTTTLDLAEMPTIGTLIKSLSVQADSNILHAQAIANKSTITNLEKIPSEFMGMMFSGMVISSDASPSNNKPNAEEIVEEKDIPKFQPQFSISSIPSFNAEDSFSKPDAITGPFGVFLKEISILETDDSVIQLKLNVEGKGFENLSEDFMHKLDDYNAIEIKVLSVEDTQGNSLLREEKCHKEPNLKVKAISTFPNSVYENGKWITKSQKASGTKEIRLNNNIMLQQVAKLKGKITLDLASQTKMATISAPFAGQEIKTDKVSIVFKDGGENKIKYKLSGETHHILDVQVKNAKGQYIDSGSSDSSFANKIKLVTRNIKGQPATIEITYATKMENKVFPFEVNNITPKYNVRFTEDQPSVKKTTKSKFLRKHSSQKYKKDSCKDQHKVNLGSFMLCMRDFKEHWGREVGGDFSIYAPVADNLKKNLNAIEVGVDTVTTKSGKEIPFNKSKTASSLSYMNDSTYDKDTKKQIIINEHLNDSNISIYSDDKELKGVKIARVKGSLKVKLPKKINSFTLKADALGKRVEHNNIIAKISKFEDYSTYIELQGDVSKIIQLRARSADGAILNTQNDRINKKEFKTWGLSKEDKVIIDAKPETWEGMISISGKPEYIDIIYSETFDVLEYPFEFKVKQ